MAITLSKIYNNGVRIRFAYKGTNQEIPWNASTPVWLKLKKIGHLATGWVSTDRNTWTQVGTEFNIDSLDNYSTNSNSWVGNFNGLYASNKTADFDNFTWRDGFDIIRGGDFQNQLGVQRVETDSSSLAENIGNGDWVLYGRIDLGNSAMKADSFLISAAVSNTGGAIELRLDEPTGTLIGTCQITSTGGLAKWQRFACPVTASGVHDLYLCFKGGADVLFNIKDFSFKQGTDAVDVKHLQKTVQDLAVKIGKNRLTIYNNGNDCPSVQFINALGKIWYCAASPGGKSSWNVLFPHSAQGLLLAKIMSGGKIKTIKILNIRR